MKVIKSEGNPSLEIDKEDVKELFGEVLRELAIYQHIGEVAYRMLSTMDYIQEEIKPLMEMMNLLRCKTSVKQNTIKDVCLSNWGLEVEERNEI
jgi:hypothetical protein